MNSSAPRVSAATPPPDAREVVTTQLTSKSLKKQQLWSLLLTGVSVVAVLSPISPEAKGIWALGFVVGGIWYLSVRFRIWWRHG